MTPELEALARRAVACKRFAPRFGMRSSGGWTVVGLATRGRKEGDRIDMLVAKQPDVLSDVVVCSMQLEDFLPDLTDAATLGCLLAMVREAHDDHLVFAYFTWRVDQTWKAKSGEGYVLATGLSEAEALVAALEAAP